MPTPYQPGTWTKPKGVAQGQMQALNGTAVEAIRAHLKARGRPRDVALFEVAIATMLRGSDLVRLRVRDVTDDVGAVRDSFPVVQGKVSGGKAHTVVVYLPEPSRLALADLVSAEALGADDYLFRGKGRKAHLSTCQLRLLIKDWCRAVGLNPRVHSNHSLRRTKASALYKQTRDLELVRQALGHAYLSSTQAYLSVHADEVRAACLSLRL